MLGGGSGDDVLEGGAGRDVLFPGDGVNRADGGAGRDTVSFANLSSGTSTDLARGLSVRRGGGRTTIVALEDVAGGLGRDRLASTNGPNRLSGGGGDTLVGRGGADDLVSSGFGAASLDAGPGDDVLASGDRNDRVSCGPGSDLLTTRSDTAVPRDCERIALPDAFRALSHGRLAGARHERIEVRLTGPCSLGFPTGAYRIRL